VANNKNQNHYLLYLCPCLVHYHDNGTSKGANPAYAGKPGKSKGSKAKRAACMLYQGAKEKKIFMFITNPKPTFALVALSNNFCP
jgi:hypothetical protein